MNRLFFAAVLVVSIVMVSNASAYTITFDDLEVSGNTYFNPISSYSAGPYQLTADSINGLRYPGQDSSFYHDSAALTFSYDHEVVSLQRSDGAAFSLNSIDLIANGIYDGAKATFTAYDLADNVVESVTSPAVTFDWQTFVFSEKFNDVYRVTWVQAFPYYQFDNIVLDAVTPIPGAIWLLGTGLVGIVGLRKTRRVS